MSARGCGFVLALLCSLSLFAQPHEQKPSVFSTFPVPPESKALLFYIQRNKNANTIVYEARLGADGKLAGKDPVMVNWIRYTEGGKREPISVLENNVAYGVRHKRTENGVAWMKFAATGKYPFTVELNKDGQAEARTFIGGTYARLEHVEIQAKEDSFWPTILHIDIFGTELGSGRPVQDRYIP